MSKTGSSSLYIFVTSERPDQYLNSVVHCYLHRNISKIVFLYIKGTGDPEIGTNPNRGVSLSVSRNVQSLLEQLANGKYKFYRGSGEEPIVDLGGVYQPPDLAVLKRIYKQCLDADLRWENIDVEYSALRAELSKINKREPNSVFDVTAVSKAFLGDIVACCIVEGIHSLYTFELKRKPDFEAPWSMLFHELDNVGGKNLW